MMRRQRHYSDCMDNDSVERSLGSSVRALRVSQRKTQAELAARSSLSESYLSLLETGKRDPVWSTLETISRALQVPISLLVFLAADATELAALGIDVKEKLSAALFSLLQANADAPKSANV